jgi:integrase/recombinase XerD
MFETLLVDATSIACHEEVPYAKERARYLTHCTRRGDTPKSLRNKRSGLYWAACIIGSNANLGVSAEHFHAAAQQWAIDHGFDRGAAPILWLAAARPWLRFLGWWRDPVIHTPFQTELDGFCSWLKSERGMADITIDQWRRRIRLFLRWYGSAGRPLAELVPSDIDRYLAYGRAQGWCRISSSTFVTALRAFLRYAGSQGWCAASLVDTIERPRLYKDERLPFGPDWSDVRQLLQDLKTGHPRDVRNYAIVLLLAIYGMRVGEVLRLRLTDLDWERELLWVPRAKRRAPQAYPLVAIVGNGIARYLRDVRPRTNEPEVFLGMRSPHRPLTQGAIYAVIGPRLKQLGCALSHFGPHALRHACARRLVASGLTLKEIGDHLGHRSPSSTRVYAKVDLPRLREVAAFDLGDVL